MADATRMDTIYRVEFRKPKDALLRYAVLILAALLYFFDYGDGLALVWVSTYIAMHLVLWGFVKRFRKSADRRLHDAAAVWAYVMLVALVAYPVQQVVQGPPAAAFGGAAILGCIFIYALAHNDRDMSSIKVWTVAFATTMLLLLVGLLPKADSVLAVIGILFAALGLLAFFVFAMRTSRRLRLQAHEAAERATQEQKLAAIGRLAGGVAHDFNNALTGISGNIELYFELEDPNEREALLQNVQDASARAARLVQQLLVFSRKSGMNRELADAKALIHEAAAFKRPLLPAHISLDVAAPGSVFIDVDKQLVVTALINLAANAVDAMPDGGKLGFSALSHTVDTALDCVDGRRLPEGRYVRFKVSDTGQGIDPAILPRVVEPFYSTKPVGQGSGLGLSMVVGLAQSLDGGVQIETGKGGTDVSLLLPVA